MSESFRNFSDLFTIYLQALIATQSLVAWSRNLEPIMLILCIVLVLWQLSSDYGLSALLWDHVLRQFNLFHFHFTSWNHSSQSVILQVKQRDCWQQSAFVSLVSSTVTASSCQTWCKTTSLMQRFKKEKNVQFQMCE